MGDRYLFEPTATNAYDAVWALAFAIERYELIIIYCVLVHMYLQYIGTHNTDCSPEVYELYTGTHVLIAVRGMNCTHNIMLFTIRGMNCTLV